MQRFLTILQLPIIVGATLLSFDLVSAQIVPDGTLPENSIVTPIGNTLQIDGGTKAGTNLFHSFQKFSVPTNNTAAFNNALDIQNIFSRVIGNSISNIDGIIKANGTANLFLINPNGIVFGSNAALNIGGSFVASTANRLIFSDGFVFSTTESQTNPLLTINVPIGLGFGNSPGQIINQSRAAVNILLPGRMADPTIAGLQVKEGKTLALVGGDVILDGGNLTANGGRIELGSVAENNPVSLTYIEKGWQLGYEDVQNFQDIRLLPRTIVDTSGNTGGEIHLQGRMITLAGDRLNSPVLAFSNTVSDGQGGSIIAKASEEIKISGDFGRIQTQAGATAIGNAGNIILETKKLTLREGGQILSLGSLGNQGKAGNILIDASEQIEMSDTIIPARGRSPVFTLIATNARTGDGGNLSIQTRNLTLKNGAQIETLTLGQGKAGNIIINASDIEVNGKSKECPNCFSGILAQSEITSSGHPGNITLQTERLKVLNEGFISTTTFTKQPGGLLTIYASESILVENGGSLLVIANIGSSGNAGNLLITTGQLNIEQRGKISSETNSIGEAGNITLNVDKLIVQERGEIVSTSAFRSDEALTGGQGGTLTINATKSINVIDSSLSTLTIGKGNAGNLIIDTNNLNITNGAQITASTTGEGQAGNVNIAASNIFVGTDSRISVESTNRGNAGDITLNTEKLLINDGGRILADAKAEGTGGTITIQAANSVELTDAFRDNEIVKTGLFTQTEGTGDAGSISLKTNNLSIREGSEINARTENQGKAGSISVTASNLSLEEAAKISVETTSTGNAGDITLNTNGYFIIDKGAAITANTSGTGDAGKITLNTNNFNVQDGAQITTSTTGEGKAGSIFVTASTFSLSNGGKLLTTTAGIQNAGDIQIQTDNLSLTGLGSGLFANTEESSAGNGGNILVNSQTTDIQNGATISVNSQGTGIGGNITLQGNTLTLNNQASLVAETASSQGGNINLTLNDLLLLRNQSNISATAAQFGDGGNITINAPFILAVPQENSDITANAEGGKGGNINITTQGILGIQFRDQLTELSDITVTSEFGLQGNVNIINPNADIINRLVEFPENPVDVTSLIAENVCTSDEAERSSFVVTGRGGLPPNPSDPLTQNGTVDWATRSQQEQKSPVILKERSQNHQPVIQQIQGWKVAADGTIILTADASAVTPESPILTHPTCQSMHN